MGVDREIGPIDAAVEQQPAQVGIGGYGLTVKEWLPLEIPASIPRDDT
jgi:hypothetical protein